MGRGLTITLPGEKLVAKIAGILNEDEVVVELESMPMMSGKSHNYKKGEFIPCRRQIDDLQVECWVAVSENELSAAAAAQTLERTRQLPEPDVEEKPAEKGPIMDNWSA